LGIFIVRSRVFRCSLDHPKKASIVQLMPYSGKVGRIASEEVVLQLLNSKCIPVLLYGLEAYPLLKSDLSSADFVIVRFLMKLFNTTNNDIINNCPQFFDVKLPSTLRSDLVRKYEKKFAECDHIFFNFSLDSIVYIYLLVKFLFCLCFCFFHVYLLPVMVNKDVYITPENRQFWAPYFWERNIQISDMHFQMWPASERVAKFS